MKVIATATTMPNRIKLIRPALDTILAQTFPVDHIELNIPYKCARTGEDYVIPAWLEEMEGVEIYRTTDYGAITKVAPTLIRHAYEEDTYIFSFDDDILYMPEVVECLVKDLTPTDNIIRALSIGLIDVNGNTYQVNQPQVKGNVLQGFGGVLYPPKFAKEDFLIHVETTSANEDCRVSDDIVLSNYAHSKGVDIKHPPVVCPHETFCDYAYDLTSTQKQTGGHYNRYVRVVHHLNKIGLLSWKIVGNAAPPQAQPAVVKKGGITSFMGGKRRFWG